MTVPIIYIAALVLANLNIAWFGPWISIVDAFLLIGLDLTLRDKLHERWHGDHLWARMVALVAAAGAISYLLNPATGKIAVASVLAMTLAAITDTVVYEFLYRHGWLVKINGSNAAASAVDSFVFPTVAFGGLLPAIVLGQFAAKFGGGFMWSLVLRRAK